MSGLLAERKGSLLTFRIATIYWIIGTIVSVFVVDVIMVAVGRGLKGISVGIFAAHLPVYVSEVIPAHKKEFLMAMIQWCLTWGILVMFLLGYACVKLQGTLSFRVAWGLEILPALILLLFAGNLPESPKWLVSRKRWPEALNVFQNFKNKQPKGAEKNDNQNQESNAGQAANEPIAGDIEKTIDAYCASFKNAEKCTFFDLFSKKLIKHTMIGLMIQIVIQLTGINVLMYFLVFICEMIGLGGNIKIIATSFQYVINVLFTIFPLLWLQNMRRKDVIVFGLMTLGLCLISISAVMGHFGHDIPPMNGNPAVQWEIKGKAGSAVLSLCYLFVAIFASSIACAGWIYTEEIFPKRAKSKGTALCLSTSWVVTTSLTFVGPVLLQYLKWATFLVFGSICVISSILTIFLFPETYMKTNEEVENFFVPKNQQTIFPEHAPRDKFVIEETEKASFAEESANRQAETKSFRGTSHNSFLNNQMTNEIGTNGGPSPFFSHSETSSFFGRPINLVDTYRNQRSPFDSIDSSNNSSFKVNRVSPTGKLSREDSDLRQNGSFLLGRNS